MVVKLNVDIEEELRREFKVACYQKGLQIKPVVECLLKKWIEEPGILDLELLNKKS